MQEEMRDYMNPWDLFIILILAALLIAAIIYERHQPDCTGNCTSCRTSCNRNHPGEEPRFVKRYRKDHPKKDSGSSSSNSRS